MVSNCDIKDKDKIIKLGKLLNDNFDKVNNIDDIINNNEIICYYIDNELVGFIIYKDLYKVIDLLYIVVDSNYRNRSIGSNLMSELLKLDYDKVLLEVNSNNICAINLYEKFNFKVINIRKKYYGNDDAYVMELIK